MVADIILSRNAATSDLHLARRTILNISLVGWGSHSILSHAVSSIPARAYFTKTRHGLVSGVDNDANEP